jgi:hypothetical protein
MLQGFRKGAISMKLRPLKKEDVMEKLGFAKYRLNDLSELNGGDLAGADSSYRQQLFQEFFFHLVGSIDLLAQLVNEIRGLGLDSHKVKVKSVSKELESSDRIKSILDSLYKNTQDPFPSEPYTDEAYIYRIYNYRHQVTHRRRNPLYISEYYVSPKPPLPDVAFALDPRDPDKGPSNTDALVELQIMYELIEDRCLQIMENL